MRKSRFPEEQIIAILQEHEAKADVADLLRRHNRSRETFYRWKRKFGGLGLSELRRLRQLEGENRKLKQLVADLSLDKTILQEALRKKW